MRKAQFFYLLRRGLLSGGLNLIKEGLVMASKFTTQGLSFPAQGSAEFNGSSDYIDLGPSLEAQLDGDFTISAWVNSDATGSQFLLNSITTAGTKIAFGTRFNDLGVFLGVDNGTQYWRQSAPALNTNQWYYFTATFDSSSNIVKTFVDGSDVTGVDAAIAGFGSGSGYVVLGKRNGSNDQWFDGNLANVAIWNRALSSDEINSVMFKSYDALEASEKSGLQAWYSLDDISGTSVPDSSGNGNNGTAY